MKLNKKGFAFSTMLYGSVALIAAVLYLILNINRDTIDTTYYFGEDVRARLNECVIEEIALENCYSSGRTCDATAYHGCLGVSDNQGQNTGVVIAETLKARVGNDGLIADPYINNRYIYTSSNPYNYIKFSGKTWRIVSIEPNGFIKLIDIQNYGSKKWDSGSGGVWGSNSTLYEELNNNYLGTLYDSGKLLDGLWNKPLIYQTAGGKHFNITTLVAQENGTAEGLPSVSTVTAKVGLLYLSDYIKATSNTNCQNNIFDKGDEDTNIDNCTSWLSEYKGWTLDIDGEEGGDDNGYAYYIGDKQTENTPSTTLYNVPVLEKTNVSHDVYPVVFLNRNSVILVGDGTSGNPYVLK